MALVPAAFRGWRPFNRELREDLFLCSVRQDVAVQVLAANLVETKGQRQLIAKTRRFDYL